MTLAGNGSSAAIIGLQGFSFTYLALDKPSLQDISLSVEKGECLLIAGASGTGKSTLLRCVNGTAPHFFRGEKTGTFTILDRDWFSVPIHEKAAFVGTIFQDPRRQFFASRVLSELCLGAVNMGMSGDAARARAEGVLDELGIPGLAVRTLSSLSSGEAQLVAIAGALMADPDILVMDEPSANLSPESIGRLSAALSRLKKNGKTIIIAEHRFRWLDGIADRVAVLSEGSLVYDGGMDVLKDKAFCIRYGLRYQFGDTGVDTDMASSRMTTQSRPTAVEIRNLSFGFGKKGRRLFRDFSVSIPSNLITVITGPNGAGKTTLLEIIFGLYKVQQGFILYGGSESRPHCAFSMQNPDLQLFSSRVADEIEDDSSKWLEIFDLLPLSERHPLTLSGGEMQRLVLAAAFARAAQAHPSLLLLDEPSSSLDGRHLRILKEQIDMAAAGGVTIIATTHDEDLMAGSGHVLDLNFFSGGV